MPYVQDISGCLKPLASGGLESAELEALLARVEGGLAALRSMYEEHSLPLLRLPEERGDLEGLKECAARLKSGTNDVVICGVGGSSLGAQTLAQLAGYGVPAHEQSLPHIHFFDNLDASTFASALSRLDPLQTKFLLVSKSGSTAETMMQALTALAWLKENRVEPATHFQAIAIEADNPLRSLAEREGFPILTHDPNVGGRFSVLSNVGMLPAILFGLDAAAIRAGATTVLQPVLDGAPANEVEPALGAAVAVGLSEYRGTGTNVLLSYSDRLRLFSNWYAQLWGESLGKDGNGTLPFGALGPVDQHSQLQLWLGGPNDKFHTVVMTGCKGQGSQINAGTIAGDERLSYLVGKTMGDLVDAEQRATVDTLIRNGRPTRVMKVDHVNEENLGALLMHFMLETILASHLMGVEPFEQPAVEEGKVLARQYLGEG